MEKAFTQSWRLLVIGESSTLHEVVAGHAPWALIVGELHVLGSSVQSVVPSTNTLMIALVVDTV